MVANLAKIYLKDFFTLSDIKHINIANYTDNAIELLEKLPDIIDDFFKTPAKNTARLDISSLQIEEAAIVCRKSLQLSAAYNNPNLKIYLGQGCKIEAGAMIKKNTIILPEVEVRQGAYIRGECIIGAKSVIGHCSEVKNSVLFYHVEAGHFNYIGNSIIGSYVNLGAGAKLANLEFRSLVDKQKDIFPNITLKIKGKKTLLGPSKFGALIGEGSEIGCNAVLAPGCFLAKSSKVLPNLFVKKGFHTKKNHLE